MHRSCGAGALARLLLLLLLSLSACRANPCANQEEVEQLADLLADQSLALQDCEQAKADLTTELLAHKQTTPGIPACDADDSSRQLQDVRGELESAQEELAAIEEVLQVAQARIEADEHDIEADGRDLVAALRQLSATRGALVQAQQELRRRQARLEGAAAMAGGQASCQAVVMDLQECQEGLGLMQASADAAAAQAGCTAERELLAETRRRIAELNAEKEGLLDRLRKDGAEPPPHAAALQLAPSPAPMAVGETAAAAARTTRRSELLQGQLLAGALQEVQQLEEENARLAARVAQLGDAAATAAALRGDVEGRKEREVELLAELGRTMGALDATQEQVVELRWERERCRTRLSACAEDLGNCTAQAAALVEARRAGGEAEADLAARGMALEARADQLLERTTQLTQELARTSAQLAVAQAQAEELHRERDGLRSTLTSSGAAAAGCAAREAALAEAHRLALEAQEGFQLRLAAAEEGFERRLTAAEAQHARQLEAAEAAAAAAADGARRQRLAEAEEASRQLGAAREEAARELAAAEARRAAAQQEAQSTLAALRAELEEAAAEKAAALAARRRAEEAISALEGARRDAEVVAATAQAELRVVREQKEAEVARLLRVLEAHEAANAELQRTAQLLQEAERGWLPLWARRLAGSTAAAASSLASAMRQRLAAWCAAAWDRVAARLAPEAARVRLAAQGWWGGRLRPWLLKWAGIYEGVEVAIARGAGSAAQRARAAAAATVARASAAKAAADAVVLRQLHAVPALRGLARPEVASRAVWSAVAAAVLPLVALLALALARAAVYRLRPGSAQLQPPQGDEALAALQARLGYSWRQRAGLQAALAGGGAAARLSWLGGALLQLLAAEAAFRQQPPTATPAQLDEASGELAKPAVLAARARAATLARLVVAGPGARSQRLAADKAAGAYAACLAAAYLDAGCKLDAARAVFVGAAQANGGADGHSDAAGAPHTPHPSSE